MRKRRFLDLNLSISNGTVSTKIYDKRDDFDVTKCREAIAKTLNDHCTRWCKREHVESNALNNWKLIFFRSSINAFF